MWPEPEAYLEASTLAFLNSLSAFSSAREALRAREPAALLFSIKRKDSKLYTEGMVCI